MLAAFLDVIFNGMALDQSQCGVILHQLEYEPHVQEHENGGRFRCLHSVMKIQINTAANMLVNQIEESISYSWSAFFISNISPFLLIIY